MVFPCSARPDTDMFARLPGTCCPCLYPRTLHKPLLISWTQAIMKNLWDEETATFSINLATKGPGMVKIKALKMTGRAAVFLLENKMYDKARSVLNHPFWLQHQVTKQQIENKTNPSSLTGWGKTVWGEGSLEVLLAYRRAGDERAGYMLQDMQPLIHPSGGLLMLTQATHGNASSGRVLLCLYSPFPLHSVADSKAVAK